MIGLRSALNLQVRLWLAVLIVAAVPASAQLHPNVERGFSSDKAFSIGDIDHVNLFNGNVTVTLPLGRPLAIGDSLSVGLTATYNSKLWDSRKLQPPFESTATTELHPNRLANAGFGWLVSLGRLVGSNESDVNETGLWRYQGRDGAIHDFRLTLHPHETVVADVFYTRDNSYLRLRKSGTHYLVEFPDGIVQEFEPWADGVMTRWRLKETRDPHGNYYRVAYAANQWTITDQYSRQIVVAFGPTPEPDGAYEFANLTTAVSSITIPGFGATTAKYVFTYSAAKVRRGYCGAPDEVPGHEYVDVPLLTKVELFHDTTVVETWEATYNLDAQPPATAQDCDAGVLRTLKLPTQGTIEWTYDEYYMPGGCRQDLGTDKSAGVTQRKYTAAGTGEFGQDVSGTWVYALHLTEEPDTGDGYRCSASNTYYPPPWPSSEMTNTVTSPAGDQTIYYFSVWPNGWNTGRYGEDRDEFGLPFSRRMSPAGATTFISSTQCEGACTGTNAVRTTYLAYERDADGEQFDANRRLARSKTVYNDDGDRSVETVYSNFDGVGHYRTATTSGDFGEGAITRTVTTNYNVRDAAVSSSSDVINTGTYNPADGSGFLLPGTTHPWILNTFSSVTARQSGSEASSSKQYACFDDWTGALRASRVLAGSTVDAKDLLTVYDRNTNGFVSTESRYGGDETPLQPTSITALCDYANATGSTDKPAPLGAQVRHTYSYGVRATSTPYKKDGTTSMGFKTLDLVVDATGLPSSVKDTAGVATTYSYDASGRIDSIEPPGMALIDYTYTQATSTTRARVVTTQNSASGTIQRELHFDSFGRPVLEKKTLTDSNTLVSRTTKYNEIGWKTSVSEWGTSSATRFEDFDPFGRARTIRAPDATVTTFTYTGARQITRTRNYGPLTDPSTTTTTEIYDPLGRLTKVVENAGPTTATQPVGVAVTAQYLYDVADRLTNVTLTPEGGTAQPRTFTYDGRGLLLQESHPEITGTVSYTYNAQGQVTAKTFSAGSAFNLTYAYDDAGQLLTLKAGPSGRVTKEFTYGTAGNELGRLKTAKRFNYLPGSTTDYYLVTETYSYDANGRASSRTTNIDKIASGTTTAVRSFTQSRTYTDLGLPGTLSYPQCAGCGSPDRDLTLDYTAGLLTSIPGFIDSLTYAPSGMVTRVSHANKTTDIITAPANGLPRPSSIKFQAECTAPEVTPEPADQDVERDSQITLVAGASGTTPAYAWSRRPATSATWVTIAGANGPSLTTTVSEETYFRLTVTNSCGSDTSRDIRVTVYDRPSISVQPASDIRSGGETATLFVTAAGTAPLTYQWYRGQTGDTSQQIAAPAGTQSSYTTPALWATTSYWVRVSNAYATVDSQTATITIQLPAPTGLTATALDSTHIRVTWNASSHAGKYRLERKSAGTFVSYATVTAPTIEFTDIVTTGKAYAYRVIALDANGLSDSARSNPDFASVCGFTPVESGMPAEVEVFDEILAGINALRIAAGKTTLTWAALVAAPTPDEGVLIRAAHIQALRDQANLARGVLGFPVWTFSDTITAETTDFRAVHLTQLQDALR